MEVRYRKLLPEEVSQQRDKFKNKYPWAAEPNWSSVWCRVEGGEITAIADVQLKVLVANLDADSPEAAYGIINWVDGMLNTYVQYEFEVPNSNERFQSALEKHFGLKASPEFPRKLYIVNRYEGKK